LLIDHIPEAPNSDQESEPEFDLSGFLALQRARADTENDHSQISPLASTTPAHSHSLRNVGEEASDDDVDHTLAALMSSSRPRNGVDSEVRKGNKRVVEWGEDMETMQRETKAAEAMRGVSPCLCVVWLPEDTYLDTLSFRSQEPAAGFFEVWESSIDVLIPGETRCAHLASMTLQRRTIESSRFEGKSPIADYRVPADEVQLKEEDMEAFLDDLLG
jgi:hypothetical protein